MKGYVSLLALASRSSIYKIIAILLAMGAFQGVLFFQCVRKAAEINPGASLEGLLSESHIALVAAAAFAAVCVVLSMTGTEFSGSKVSYTLMGLRVRERDGALLWSLYNGMCFLLFWAFEAAVVLLLSRWYLSGLDPSLYHSQSLLLACYRNEFLHGLVPLEQYSLWIRNLLLAAALGIGASRFSFLQRRGKKGFGIVILGVLTLVFFPQVMGSTVTDSFIGLICLIQIIAGIAGFWGGEEDGKQ